LHISLDMTKEAKFEWLMREYGRKILHLVYMIVKDRNTAEDITQDVFVKIYNHLELFRGESSIHTWMYKIAVNEARKHVRSWSFRNIFPTEKAEDLANESLSFEGEPKLLDSLNREEFAKYILLLPLQYRQAIALYYYQDLSSEEMAAVLGISDGAARNKLYRARKKLKEILEREGFVWD
jgi:RNA polymerase sigma-70 factor, ECF subfamily